MLVCPLCKGPLEMLRTADQTALGCRADRLAFPIRDGIALMLESEAHAWDPDADPAPALTVAP